MPMPPLKSKQLMPVPAPTQPSATGPAAAPSRAARTCSSRTCMPRRSLRNPSSHSPTTGMTASSMPASGLPSIIQRTVASYTAPALCEFVSSTGVSMRPHSRMALMPMTSPTPLAAKAPATTRLCQMSSPCGKIAVTPVRAGPLPCGSSGPPHETVQWPTRDAGHVGDGVQRAGGQNADGDAEVARPRPGPPRSRLFQKAGAVRLEVVAAEVVLAAQRLDGLDGGHHLLVAHVEDEAVDAETGAHRHEGAVE